MLLDFFDPSKPCPPEFPNCAELRKQYEQELQNMQNSGGCSSCKLNGLKNKYINIMVSSK